MMVAQQPTNEETVGLTASSSNAAEADSLKYSSPENESDNSEGSALVEESGAGEGGKSDSQNVLLNNAAEKLSLHSNDGSSKSILSAELLSDLNRRNGLEDVKEENEAVFSFRPSRRGSSNADEDHTDDLSNCPTNISYNKGQFRKQARRASDLSCSSAGTASRTQNRRSSNHSASSGGTTKSGISRSSMKQKFLGMLNRSSTKKNDHAPTIENIKSIWKEPSAYDGDQWGCQSSITADDLEDEGTKFQCRKRIIDIGQWCYDTLKTAIISPGILIPCLLMFATICTIGLIVVQAFNSSEATSRRENAESLAVETDIFFTRVLESAFVPLFTMAQFVRELPEFHDMPFLVGDRCDPATTDCSLSLSAPIMDGKETHRNLTGVFPPGLEEKFSKIAEGIKKNSGLGKALVNIQLAPKAVVSMFYPLINCADFEDGLCLDNTGAVGHDLLNDPNRVGIARATVPADGVVTAGPLALVQGEFKEAFIARLPINMPGHSIVVDGVDYPCWGFAVILLNWATLKKESDIYNNYARSGMQFKLTRTDVKIDPETGEEMTKVVTIAESSESHLIANENVTLDLETGDNGWQISVGYNDGFSPHYEIWGYPTVICSGFILMILMMMVLVSKKQHESLLHKLLPKRAIKKLRRGKTVVENYNTVTIFFSDIVGYTTMSSEMTPMEVMTMLNIMYTKFDELCEKYDIYKVETIGDAFIAVGGCPKKCSGPRGAEKVALFALEALKVVEEFKTPSGAKVYIRAGLASGPVVAGVIGFSLPKYTLFGDTVNFASRMESTSETMRLQVSPITHRLLRDAPSHNFEFEERRDENGELGIEVKGKGRQFTWWVNSASKIEKAESVVANDADDQTFHDVEKEGV